MKTNMHTLGEYIANKYRHRANMVGVRTVAQQLRKQGFSLDMALLILLGTRERPRVRTTRDMSLADFDRLYGQSISELQRSGLLTGSDTIEAAMQREHLRQMAAMQAIGWRFDWSRQQNAHSFGNPGWLFGIRAAGL